ncbi:GGDEF domain-containing protein [Indiicoccus explosivorum]|uniref:GGDEF domain-containing protein n=1 Tax=Indiicoccus explosivorum TaxID=1917864 RepID=UPI000B43DB2D|nr:GGDEF domain-containing protein [Indiicoccus explosivorum]
MIHLLSVFLANITFIASFMVVFLKLKEMIVKKAGSSVQYYSWSVPLFFSLMSVAVMAHPVGGADFLFDLRAVPVFLLAYVFGWRLGLLGVLLPTLFHAYLGGPDVFPEAAVGIWLPYVTGAVFHRPADYKPPYTLIPLRYMLCAFLASAAVRLTVLSAAVGAEMKHLLILFLFELSAVLCMALMLNDSNRKMLAIRELEILSRTDSMTNLYNLSYFRQNVKKLERQRNSFVIAMFDVDHFKQFNDTHGHPAGDAVLQKIGRILMNTMRPEDLYARYGGEEFVLCFTGVRSRTDAVAIAERLRRKVESEAFPGEETQPGGRLTISIGLSGILTDKTFEEAIMEADQALYRAKRAGRNRVAV